MLAAGRVPYELGLLAAGAASDVLDGWAARRQPAASGESARRGEWLDPLCDKLFMGCVIAGLSAWNDASLTFLLLTITRELLQIVLLAVYRAIPALRSIDYRYRAHPIGKATTVAQFLAATAFVFEHPAAHPLAVASAVGGLGSVAVYVNRALVLRQHRLTTTHSGGPGPGTRAANGRH